MSSSVPTGRAAQTCVSSICTCSPKRSHLTLSTCLLLLLLPYTLPVWSTTEACSLIPGDGDSSMKCPDVCVWGLKMYPLRRTPLVKKHTHIEGIICTLHTLNMITIQQRSFTVTHLSYLSGIRYVDFSSTFVCNHI